MDPADSGSKPGSAAEHPGPATVRLSASIAEAITAHAEAGRPDEACGLIIGSAEPAAGGAALRFEPCRNEAASPVRFRIQGEDLYRVVVTADDAGEALWAIVHSHVRSPAVPSATDVEMASWWPSLLHVLVSLDPGQADPATGRPSLRAWRIVEGAVFEVVVDLA